MRGGSAHWRVTLGVRTERCDGAGEAVGLMEARSRCNTMDRVTNEGQVRFKDSLCVCVCLCLP